MKEKFQKLPLRNGVGIAVLNKENKIFVAKRIDNPADFWQMPHEASAKNQQDYQFFLQQISYFLYLRLRYQHHFLMEVFEIFLSFLTI